MNNSNSITLKDFLKRFTAISNSFIDEYLSFYDMCVNNQFGIDLDKVIDYLEIVKKEKFYKRFRGNYQEQLDYKILRFKQKSIRGVKDTKYYINLDTFEKICMMSKSQKANAVRDYFILLRKFINYYKNHISGMILDKIINKKVMYIIVVNKGKKINKLGRSKNQRKRMYGYATGKDVHPDIKFIILVDDALKVENCTKIFLEQYRYRGKSELYKVDVDFLKSLLFDCAEIGGTIYKKNMMKKYDVYVMYDDYDNAFGDIEYLNENNEVVKYKKILKATHIQHKTV